MSDDELAGFSLGLILASAVFLVGWHVGEMECQRKHNVADCVFAGFEPRIQEKNHDTRSKDNN